MPQDLSTQVSNWLRQLEIPVSNKFLKKELLSHPDYPSLACIIDVLSELTIECTPLEIERKHLYELPIPFLAHLRSNGGEFVIISSSADFERKFPDFFEKWSKVVVIAERPQNWKHKENDRWLQKEKQEKLIADSLILILSLFIAASIFYQQGWQYFSLLLMRLQGYLSHG